MPAFLWAPQRGAVSVAVTHSSRFVEKHAASRKGAGVPKGSRSIISKLPSNITTFAFLLKAMQFVRLLSSMFLFINSTDFSSQSLIVVLRPTSFAIRRPRIPDAESASRYEYCGSFLEKHAMAATATSLLVFIAGL